MMDICFSKQWERLLGFASVPRTRHSELVEGLRFCFVGLVLVDRAILRLLSYQETSHGVGDLKREGCMGKLFTPKIT